MAGTKFSDYLGLNHYKKTIFVYGSYEFLAMLEGKIKKTPFFKGSMW
jgi:hypothetical protein